MTPQQIQEQADKLYPVNPVKVSETLIIDSNKLGRDGFLAGAQWMQEREKSEARQAIIDAKVFRICSSCNTEFEMEFGVSISEKVSAFQKCTHCGVRNDTWISIRLNGQKD